MFKWFTKHGNSLAVIIDKPILELLKMNENTKLFIRTDGKNIILGPADEQEVDKISDNPKLQKMYEKFVEKHKETLKKLAE